MMRALVRERLPGLLLVGAGVGTTLDEVSEWAARMRALAGSCITVVEADYYTDGAPLELYAVRERYETDDERAARTARESAQQQHFDQRMRRMNDLVKSLTPENADQVRAEMAALLVWATS